MKHKRGNGSLQDRARKIAHALDVVSLEAIMLPAEVYFLMQAACAFLFEVSRTD